MPNSHEIELKFLCAPEDLAAVLAAAPAGTDQTGELISVYFDTPDLTLQKAGVSLRVRQSEGRRVQTVKRGEGLSREEDEAPVDSDRPDPGLGLLKEILPAEPQLDPAFNVRVTRRQRAFRYQDAEIELALDQGEVSRGRVTSPICEVELELKAGAPEALFALARELSKVAALYLSFDGKAARGQALAAGASLAARRNAQVALAHDATAVEAFQAVARNALGLIAANAALLRTEPSVEAVHQLRVAARRLRSALSTFKPILGGPGLGTVKADLRWLAQSCNDARNLDVFAEDLAEQTAGLDAPPPGIAGLAALLQAARDDARSRACGAVATQRFRLLMIDTVAWVETGDWLATAPRASAVSFGDKALRRRLRKVLKARRDLHAADDQARHHLRISAKKLRYAADAFASLAPPKAARRFIDRVKDLQTALGDLNDLGVAQPLIAGLGLPAEAAFVAGELHGLRMAERPRMIDLAAKALDRLHRAPELRLKGV